MPMQDAKGPLAGILRNMGGRKAVVGSACNGKGFSAAYQDFQRQPFSECDLTITDENLL
jgi:hypothetical protein